MAKKDATGSTSSQNASSKKRKQEAGQDLPNKTQRRSGRGGSQPSQEQLLDFLLSKKAEDFTRPEDELDDIKARGEIRTYASSMNPFEELMCAIVLSRPISHRLGLRTIRTILNDPYNFTTAKAIKDAGSEKQHQALVDARTQHKDKTAQQLGQLAEVVLEQFSTKDDASGKELGQVLSDSKGDIDKLRNTLKSAINGLGATGLDIFSRRVQWLWDDIYPFIDNRTADSLRKFNLPHDADKLTQTVDEHWKKVNTKHITGSNDGQKKRRAFVVILERVISADLEGKVEAAIAQASQ